MLLRARVLHSSVDGRAERLLTGTDKTQFRERLMPMRLVRALRPAVRLPYPMSPEACGFHFIVCHVDDPLLAGQGLRSEPGDICSNWDRCGGFRYANGPNDPFNRQTFDRAARGQRVRRL